MVVVVVVVLVLVLVLVVFAQTYLGQHSSGCSSLSQLIKSAGPLGQSTSSQKTTLLTHIQISMQGSVVLISAPFE